MFAGVFSQSIIKRAKDKELLKIKLVNIRDFAKDKHKTVDDRPYGGGYGMILRVDVVAAALEAIRPKPFTILLSATGKKYSQKEAIALSKKQSIALICGHYEGVDARIEKFVDRIISIGDFVLTGGEIAAMAIVDSVVRLLPGVIKKESTEKESFSKISSSLEYPQYTRPKEFRGLLVPKVLLGGNHQEITKWRAEQSVKRTQRWRPDLIKK